MDRIGEVSCNRKRQGKGIGERFKTYALGDDCQVKPGIITRKDNGAIKFVTALRRIKLHLRQTDDTILPADKTVGFFCDKAFNGDILERKGCRPFWVIRGSFNHHVGRKETLSFFSEGGKDRSHREIRNIKISLKG